MIGLDFPSHSPYHPLGLLGPKTLIQERMSLDVLNLLRRRSTKHHDSLSPCAGSPLRRNKKPSSDSSFRALGTDSPRPKTAFATGNQIENQTLGVFFFSFLSPSSSTIYFYSIFLLTNIVGNGRFAGFPVSNHCLQEGAKMKVSPGLFTQKHRLPWRSESFFTFFRPYRWMD
jgi:hypothetical protein